MAAPLRCNDHRPYEPVMAFAALAFRYEMFYAGDNDQPHEAK
jgi:hypothetical protein